MVMAFNKQQLKQEQNIFPVLVAYQREECTSPMSQILGALSELEF